MPSLPDITTITTAAKNAKPPPPELREVARDFEALVFQQLLKHASKPIVKGGPFDRGPGARLYREMFFQELAGVAGRKGSLGIAELLSRDAATPEDER